MDKLEKYLANWLNLIFIYPRGKLCILCNSQILRKLSEISQIYMSWMTKKNISYVCIFMPLQYQVHKAKVVQVWSTLSFPISFINIRADICLAHTNYVFFALIQSLGSAWAKGGLASKLSELVLLPKLGALMHTRQPAHRITSTYKLKTLLEMRRRNHVKPCLFMGKRWMDQLD